MAVIIPQFKDIANKTVKPYVYKDISLDLSISQTNLNIHTPLQNSADIQVNYDTQAILTSLFNLFNTCRGERFLFPLYGSDIGRFIFEPMTSFVANSLGTAINVLIKNFEPRIQITKTVVDVLVDQNLFNVSVYFIVIATNQQSALNVIVPGNNNSNSKIIQVTPFLT